MSEFKVGDKVKVDDGTGVIYIGTVKNKENCRLKSNQKFQIVEISGLAGPECHYMSESLLEKINE
jgi:hypothetical protein